MHFTVLLGRLWMKSYRRISGFQNSVFKPNLHSEIKHIFVSVAKTSFLRIAKMNTFAALTPPERVKGMKKWEKTAFKDEVCVPSLACPTERLDKVRKFMHPLLLMKRKMVSIVDLDSEDGKNKTHRLLLLDPAKVQAFESFSEDIVKKLNEEGITERDFKAKWIELNHENWNFSDIIRAIVPDEIGESSSGYTEIGHIAHFNLREELLPYRYVIGEVLLEQSKRIKTVVNKTNVIDNTYRTFKLELLAGEENYITHVKENNCLFEMDFSKVYWNSRLGKEHSRVIQETKHGDVVFDVFAGIGPFALPCAKQKVTVFANDLNPVSFEYLLKNRQKNKITEDRLKAFNLDGREFIQTVVKEELTNLYTEGSIFYEYKVHIVMNLPAMAVTFIDAFQSLLEEAKLTIKAQHEPVVYCYCFTDHYEADKHFDGDTKKEIKARVRKYLPALSEDEISLLFVRNVAPNKDMMRINFILRSNILCGQHSWKDETEEPPVKCRRTEEGTDV